MSEAFDFSAYQAEPKDGLIKRIVEGGNKQLALASDVEQATKLLASKKAEYERHRSVYMPKLFEEATIPELVRGKYKLKLVTKTRTSVPMADDQYDRRMEAYKWLEDNGEGKLIKAKFTIEVDNMNKELISEVKKMLSDKGLEYELKRSHHAGALESVINSKMEDGVDVPQEVFGVFDQKYCDIKVSKKK